MAQESVKTRRRRSASLRAQVVAECAVACASVASVALAHGLNANLVHRWRRITEGREHDAARTQQPAGFMALALDSVQPPVAAQEICIEVRRTGMLVSVRWPVSAAGHSAAWLRELLR